MTISTNNMKPITDQVEGRGSSLHSLTAIDEYTDAEMSSTTDSKDEGKEGAAVSQPLYTNTNGRFFGWASLFFSCCSTFLFMTNFVVWLCGYGWTRNPMKFVLGLSPPQERSERAELVLSAHAIMGVIVTCLALSQVVSAVRFYYTNGKQEERLRLAHRVMGRLTAAVWLAVIAIGASYLAKYATAKDWNTDLGGNFNSLFVAVMTFASGILSAGNMSIAVHAVLKKDKDFFTHKCGMMFALLYVFRSGLNEIILMIIQLVYSSCPVETIGGTLALSLGESLQYFGLMMAAWWWDSALFRSRLFLANLFFWFWFGPFPLITAFAVSARDGGYHEGECFSGTSVPFMVEVAEEASFDF